MDTSRPVLNISGCHWREFHISLFILDVGPAIAVLQGEEAGDSVIYPL